MQKPYYFLDILFEIQRKMIEKEIIDLDFAKILIHPSDNSVYWNYALLKRNISITEMREIEQILKDNGKKSTIYFEDSIDFVKTKTLLVENLYSHSYTDSFMFYEGNNLSNFEEDKIFEVIDFTLLNDWIVTLDKSYQDNDPQNPYGSQKAYLSTVEKSWVKNNKWMKYYICYNEKLPVSIATLMNFNKIGYIANVGSLREIRGKGFGKSITLHCVKESINLGNEYHFLATEEGTFPNEFYKRIGFNTKFKGTGYSLN